MKIIKEWYGPRGGKFTEIECSRDGCTNTTVRTKTKMLRHPENAYCGRDCYIKELPRCGPIQDINCTDCGVLVKGEDRILTGSGFSSPSKKCRKCKTVYDTSKRNGRGKRQLAFLSKFKDMKWE